MKGNYNPRCNVHHEKHFSKPSNFTSKKHNKKHNKKQLVLDQNLALDFVDFLVSKGVISKEDIVNGILDKKKELDSSELKIVENGVIVNKGQKIDKGALRQLWLEQMRNHQLYCCLCGQPITTTNGGSPWRLTAEHTRPKSKGGKSDSTNLLPAHSVCNGLKTNMMPQVWERVGYGILTNRGIKVDMSHVSYRYIMEHRRQYSR